jgi:hypothetical protein
MAAGEAVTGYWITHPVVDMAGTAAMVEAMAAGTVGVVMEAAGATAEVGTNATFGR